MLLSSGSGPEIGLEFGRNPARKAAFLIGEECPGPQPRAWAWVVGAVLHGPRDPPRPRHSASKSKIRKLGLPFWEEGLKIQV